MPVSKLKNAKSLLLKQESNTSLPPISPNLQTFETPNRQPDEIGKTSIDEEVKPAAVPKNVLTSLKFKKA